ncbi:DUF397 domain-containing protein [Streptomyces uncialis]|uniref:DUF397 domain-containing protein n=1 Tax=Streptomyces uncialis TaxID=1048205 RepID=UPI0037FAF4C5
MQPNGLAGWAKSGYSDGDGANCVEWAPSHASAHGVVPVRDSKAPDRAVLAIAPRLGLFRHRAARWGTGEPLSLAREAGVGLVVGSASAPGARRRRVAQVGPGCVRWMNVSTT